MICFVVDSVAKLIFESVVIESDDLPSPTLWSSLISFPVPPPLALGNSLSNSCWTVGYWFSCISPFTMFTKSINNFTISFGAFSLFMIPFMRGMHGPLAVDCLNELPALQVCVACLTSISSVSKSKVRSFWKQFPFWWTHCPIKASY